MRRSFRRRIYAPSPIKFPQKSHGLFDDKISIPRFANGVKVGRWKIIDYQNEIEKIMPRAQKSEGKMVGGQNQSRF
ncbi:MAG: hypothetical protein Q4D62_16215, partial [Planctomycetia bacterium]|nr:hypothetical protein [Planctomycetia bacterium]